MNILGIDTSCDETAAAVVVDGREILSNIISSQIDLHRKYGGVVPELASRKHVESINYIVDQAMMEAGTTFDNLGAIAVTNRPGLIGALLVGVATAKSMAYAHDLPLLGINHIEGHIYANFMVHEELPFPHVCLTVSGGHTLLVDVQTGWRYEVLGGTLDDAAGEAYDKVAQYLGLGFPGGKVIDDLAKQGDPAAIEFPRPMLDSGDYQFSFSGIKTAVRYYVENAKSSGTMPPIENIAASFQAAVVDVLVQKTLNAAEDTGARVIGAGGGVLANRRLRARLADETDRRGLDLYVPSPRLCVDNGAMIGAAAVYRLERGEATPWGAGVDPGLRLGAV